jgi:hypothetical protein
VRRLEVAARRRFTVASGSGGLHQRRWGPAAPEVMKEGVGQDLRQGKSSAAALTGEVRRWRQ